MTSVEQDLSESIFILLLRLQFFEKNVFYYKNCAVICKI